MLNYNDDEQTLMEFYKTSELDGPLKTAPRDAADFARDHDPEFLDNLTTSQQYDALNEYLIAEAAHHSFQHPDHDYRDPLMGYNLVKKLVNMGIVESESDPQLQKFLISSQAFVPQAYLSCVHKDTPIEDLVKSLNGLDSNIRRQTSELKSILNDNFEDFLSCKKSIDDVLTSFKQSKSRAQADAEKTKVFNPASKRNRRKIDEGENLLSELEESINNLNLSSSLMIRPIMDHNARETKISQLVEFISANRFLFDLPLKLVDYLSTQNHDAFIEDYKKFMSEKEYIEDRQSRALSKAKASGDPDAVRAVEQVHNLQNTALLKVYKEVNNIADEYRKKCFQDLLSMDHEVSAKRSRKLTSDVNFIDLVDKLHRMSNEENDTAPIRDFLESQLDKIENELTYQHEKFCTRFQSMQQKVLDYITSLSEQREDGSFVKHIAEKFDSVEEYFKASSAYTTSDIGAEKENVIMEIFGNNENLDLSIINETWLVLSNFIKFVEEFMAGTVSKFVKNYLHYADPKRDPDLDAQGHLQEHFFAILNGLISKIMEIFEAGNVTDQMKVTPSNYVSFLPHHTNSLSTMFYLGAISQSICKIFTLAGTYTTQIGNSTKNQDTNKQIKALRETSLIFDQRILEAICATWVNDCSQFFDLEEWEKYNDFEDRRMKGVIFTKVMQIIYYYELFILEALDRIFVRKNETSPSEVRIVSPYPNKRILVSLEIQFMRSMNVLVDSNVKRFTVEKARVQQGENRKYETEECIYKILTMNNLTTLGDFIFQKLIQKFDGLFERTLQKQNLRLFAHLDKVKMAILDDINEIEKAWIETRIEKHFTTVDNNASVRHLEIDPFVYDCLLHFVKLVHVLKPITDTTTFVTVVQQLQTHFLIKFLSCIRTVSEKERLIVQILGNIKLDLDFFVEVFEASEILKLDDYCLNLVQIILGHIEKVEGMFSDLGYSSGDIDQKLYKALEFSANEFTCFV